MREYLFRGKRVDTGEWICGDLVHSMYHRNDTCIKGPNGVFDVTPESVGQYIGVCDKNGKKIFDGDILYFHDGDELCVVEWNEEESQYVGYIYHKLQCKMEYPQDCYFEAMEIVGNIHDNQE